jgi:hypothetical protein
MGSGGDEVKIRLKGGIYLFSPDGPRLGSGAPELGR